MNKFKPALLGGLIVGVLSAIPILYYCCVIWGIVGGGLACYLYIKSSPVPVRPGDGAILGGLAGIIGAVIFFVIWLPINFFIGAAALQDAMARSGMQLPVSGIVLFILVGLISSLVPLLFSVIGGLIAVPIFEKLKDATPPPPPQDFAG